MRLDDRFSDHPITFPEPTAEALSSNGKENLFFFRAERSDASFFQLHSNIPKKLGKA